MHRHASTKHILFTVVDNTSLIYQVKLTDFTIIPHFFGRKVSPYVHKITAHLQVQIKGSSIQCRAFQVNNFVQYKLQLTRKQDVDNYVRHWARLAFV